MNYSSSATYHEQLSFNREEHFFCVTITATKNTDMTFLQIDWASDERLSEKEWAVVKECGDRLLYYANKVALPKDI